EVLERELGGGPTLDRPRQALLLEPAEVHATPAQVGAMRVGKGEQIVTSSRATVWVGRAPKSAATCSPCSSSSERRMAPRAIRTRSISVPRSKRGGSPRRPELRGSGPQRSAN